jgi:hypothetical protein
MIVALEEQAVAEMHQGVSLIDQLTYREHVARLEAVRASAPAATTSVPRCSPLRCEGVQRGVHVGWGSLRLFARACARGSRRSCLSAQPPITSRVANTSRQASKSGRRTRRGDVCDSSVIVACTRLLYDTVQVQRPAAPTCGSIFIYRLPPAPCLPPLRPPPYSFCACCWTPPHPRAGCECQLT